MRNGSGSHPKCDAAERDGQCPGDSVVQLKRRGQALICNSSACAAFSQDLSLEDWNPNLAKKLLQSLYDDSILFRRIYLLDASGNVLWMAPYEECMLGVNLAASPYNRPIFTATPPSFFSAFGLRSKNPATALTIPIVADGSTVQLPEHAHPAEAIRCWIVSLVPRD